MTGFISYFDYLGYKKFVLNNSTETLSIRSGHILRDIEMALGLGEFKETVEFGVISDLKNSRIHCINISDTVILITKENTLENLVELLKVSKTLNNSGVFRTMPLRGALYFGHLNMRIGHQENDSGSIYSSNLIYGAVLVQAHIKAECQNWAGTVIDQSVVDRIAKETDVEHFLEPYAKLYRVPYKSTKADQKDEYVLKFMDEPINLEALKNFSQRITHSFECDNKKTDDPKVQEKLKNTLDFLKSHYNPHLDK